MDIRTTIWLVLCGLAWPTTLDAFFRRPRGFHSNLLQDDIWAPTDRLVENLGYVVESHTVHTTDGYILTLHRVPRAKNGSVDRPTHHTPVLCNSGLASNSELWMIRRDQNAALELVDAGFDIWLANFRGTFYGKRHETLHPKQHEFWDFSWHENGLLDQTAMIDYILRTTGRSKLITLGHSMGTTAQAVLMSERPEYAKEKVLCSIFLAPPISFAYPQALLVNVRSLFKTFPLLKDATGRHVVNDKMPLLDQSLITYCFAQPNTQLRNVCSIGLTLFLGKPAKPLTNVQALKMMAHFPAGASIRQVLHYGQMIANDNFAKYDFGPDKNKKLYGSASPPAYNLSAITTPIYVFYGTSDGLVSADDAEVFVNNCPAVKEAYKLPYNHMDYALSDTASEDLSKPILDIVAKYI